MPDTPAHPPVAPRTPARTLALYARDALSARQSEALEVIRRHVRVRGVPPSRRELAREMKMPNTSGTATHLQALAKKGWIALIPYVERGIKLLREGAPLLDMDALGALSSDKSGLTEERIEPPRLNDVETFADVFGATPDYFLTVNDEGLETVGLSAGDIVAVRRNAEARSGELVVIRIAGKVGLARLGSASAAQAGETVVLGVVIGAIVGRRAANRIRSAKPARGIGDTPCG